MTFASYKFEPLTIKLDVMSYRKIFLNIHESFKNMSNTMICLHAYPYNHTLSRSRAPKAFTKKAKFMQISLNNKNIDCIYCLSMLPTHRSSSSALVAAPIKYLNLSIKVNNLRITQSISSLFWWIFCCQSHATVRKTKRGKKLTQFPPIIIHTPAELFFSILPSYSPFTALSSSSPSSKPAIS